MADGVTTARVYHFGAFTVDARTGELSHAGRRTPLRDQSFQLLLALLEQPGELITREELTGRLWAAGTFVDFDRGLNKAILHLRDALGDSAEQPHFIETLPRKGYRFIAPVASETDRGTGDGAGDGRQGIRLRHRPVVVTAATMVGTAALLIAADVGGSREWIASRWAPPPRISSVAVIPLENLSSEPEGEYFADGMTDALITDLARMGSLRVTSRTSVMRYKATKK